MFESEYFPVMTFALAAVMLAAFLFTANEIVTPTSRIRNETSCQITCPKTCKEYLGHQVCVEEDKQTCECIIPKFGLYQNIFGFIPLSPKIYSLVTYAFIHDGFLHLFFNLVFLFIVGLAIEEVLGKWVFLGVFISSSSTAVIFDILGRFLTKFSFAAPFIGASGGIFGLLAVASVIRTNERIPVILNLLLLITLLVNFQPMISWLFRAGYAFGQNIGLMMGIFLAVAISFVLLLLPGFPSLPIVLVLFLINALAFVISGYPTTTSNVGHLGGVIGGIASLFILSEKEKH